MNNEDFKHLCEEKKVQYDKKVKQFEELLKEQEKYDLQSYAPNSRFSWLLLERIPICPICKKDLKYNFIRKVYYGDMYSEDGIYSCSCGYKYAKKQY